MITSFLPCPHGFGTKDEKLHESLGLSESAVVMSRQTHSDIVRIVARENLVSEKPCDALVTTEPGLALCIYTADCVPVLLIEPEAGVIGAAHAGWRGTANGIAAKTVRVMTELGAKPERILAAIGPAIGSCCFKTRDDVPDALRASLGDAVSPLMELRGDRWHIDLKGVNALWLKQSGVNEIEQSELCTSCRMDLFHSFRRKKSSGRQLSMICLGETTECVS